MSLVTVRFKGSRLSLNKVARAISPEKFISALLPRLNKELLPKLRRRAPRRTGRLKADMRFVRLSDNSLGLEIQFYGFFQRDFIRRVDKIGRIEVQNIAQEVLAELLRGVNLDSLIGDGD